MKRMRLPGLGIQLGVRFQPQLKVTEYISTHKGDTDRGASHYTTCSYCHGDNAQGSWSTNAPRLAGMSDWYMARQLEQFKQGHRGRHPQDFHGAQMARMSRIVSDGQATDDVLAYINTLH